jgi:hypothetical protein
VSAAHADMSARRVAEFGQLLRLTEPLKAHLVRGVWGAAAAIELERRGLVERVFDVAPGAKELPVLTATLREVVRINDELIGLAEHQRRAIARELDLLAVGREAARAYDAQGGPRQGSLRP